MKKYLLLIMSLVCASQFTSCDKSNDNHPSKENSKWYYYHKSGLYLGISGFNSSLHNSYSDGDIQILDNTTENSYKQYISNLSINDGTILYYAVEQSIEQLSHSDFPKDLTNVSIITFTDGLDQGSSAMNDKYNSATAYLASIKSKLKTTRIGGLSINAYTIGLRGNDVVDEQLFSENLKGLASSDDNVMEVSNIDEINYKFQQLADSLYKENTSQSLVLTIPKPYNNTKIRFTFDVGSIGEASNSKYYIEGTYNSNTLTNVEYKGVRSSSSGKNVSVMAESGINISFVFKDISFENDFEMAIADVKQWDYIPATGLWQVNSEFNPGKAIETTADRKTAVIILILDCSSSLGNDFSAIQTAAQNFIDVLQGRTVETPKTEPKEEYAKHIILPVNRYDSLSQLYYNAVVDWVYNNIDVPLGATSQTEGLYFTTFYGDNEYYTGCSAYQADVDLRTDSARRQYGEDSYQNAECVAAGIAFKGDGYNYLTDNAVQALMLKRLQYVMGKIMENIEGANAVADTNYALTLNLYDGEATKEATIVYKVDKNGSFKFQQML